MNCEEISKTTPYSLKEVEQVASLLDVFSTERGIRSVLKHASLWNIHPSSLARFIRDVAENK